MHGGLSAAHSRFWGALVLALNEGKVSAWVGCFTLQSEQTMIPYRKPPQLKTQPQNMTTNMSCRCPTPKRLFPQSPWQHPPWPQILAPPLTMGL
jgi:hypothetical protein